MDDQQRWWRAGLLGLLLVAACAGPGCRLFRFTTLPGETPPVQEAASDLPSKTQFRVSQYVFFADFDVNRNQPIFQELSHLREQVYKELRLPGSSTLVQVYLFENQERYEQYMKKHYPELPTRRAFFVAQPRSFGGSEDLMVYTYWGDRILQDLRHELTHALLHSVLKDVPLWLDEGLAEFFELPPAQDGVNFAHLDLLQHGPKGPFRPNLTRLEELNQVKQMNPGEYREAWAWVHLMLRGSPEARRVLVAYLNELRATDKPGALRPRLQVVLPQVEEALTRHVADLDRVKESRQATAQR
jgi:hypothetical protein